MIDEANKGARAEPPVRPSAPAHVAALDGVRAFAVIFVVLFHATPEQFPSGYHGVDVFFVLSGFLITGILIREWDRTGRVAWGAFYARRALRLLPALFVLAVALCVAYVLLLPAEERADNLWAVLAAVAYATSPLASAGVDLGTMVHAWSLSVEEYFYLVWPLSLVVLLRWAGRRRAVLAVAIVTAVAVTYRLVAAFSEWPLDRIYYAADTRAEQLLIGCLLAVVLIDRRFTPSRSVTLLAAGVLAAFVFVPGEVSWPIFRYGGSTVVAMLAAVVIAGLVAHPASRFGRVLALPPLTWLGRRSYGVYLWHLPVIGLVLRVLPAGVPTLPVIFGATLLIAAGSFWLVEQPLLRLKARFPSASPVVNPQAEQPAPVDKRGQGGTSAAGASRPLRAVSRSRDVK